MDTQLKKGILDICVLKYLDSGDSYGYQIMQKLNELVAISESTLYPILKRLEQGDYLKTYAKEYNSRLRKYYKITRAGRKRIKEFKDEWKDIKKIYNFILGGRDDE